MRFCQVSTWSRGTILYLPLHATLYLESQVGEAFLHLLKCCRGSFFSDYITHVFFNGDQKLGRQNTNGVSRDSEAAAFHNYSARVNSVYWTTTARPPLKLMLVLDDTNRHTNNLKFMRSLISKQYHFRRYAGPRAGASCRHVSTLTLRPKLERDTSTNSRTRADQVYRKLVSSLQLSDFDLSLYPCHCGHRHLRPLQPPIGELHRRRRRVSAANARCSYPKGVPSRDIRGHQLSLLGVRVHERQMSTDIHYSPAGGRYSTNMCADPRDTPCRPKISVVEPQRPSTRGSCDVHQPPLHVKLLPLVT